MIKFVIKKFNQLSTLRLYQILKLRSEVFVVEQNSVYKDPDDKDQKALHILGLKNDELVAYSRVLNIKDYFQKASIGRVVVKKDQRKYGYGHRLMEVSIKTIKDNFNQTTIMISAQIYLQKFYESHGFIKKGKPYLEDGLPHIKMLKN